MVHQATDAAAHQDLSQYSQSSIYHWFSKKLASFLFPLEDASPALNVRSWYPDRKLCNRSGALSRNIGLGRWWKLRDHLFTGDAAALLVYSPKVKKRMLTVAVETSSEHNTDLLQTFKFTQQTRWHISFFTYPTDLATLAYFCPPDEFNFNIHSSFYPDHLHESVYLRTGVHQLLKEKPDSLPLTKHPENVRMSPCGSIAGKCPKNSQQVSWKVVDMSENDLREPNWNSVWEKWNTSWNSL